MALILRHELQCEPDGCTVILHIDPQTAEFSEELNGCCNPLESKSFIEVIQCYVRNQFPDIKIKLVKIMIGSIVVATVSFSGIIAGDLSVSASTYTQTAYASYTVVSGDSLWIIANRFSTTINDIKTINNLTSDNLNIGQVLKVPQKTIDAQPTTEYTTYKVVSGDSLYIIAKRFNVTVSAIKTLNSLTTETIYLNQVLKIPAAAVSTPVPEPTPTNVAAASSYTVASGDSLWIIANKFKITIDNIKSLNNLTSDMLYVGQVLKLPSTAVEPTVQTPTPAPDPAPTPTSSTQTPTISYLTHKVVAGDNPWSLSIKYGIPTSELLNANSFTQSTVLYIGQDVKIPVHNIPVKPTPGPQYGERLDWWSEAQYVFAINKIAKVTDFATGLTFQIKRTIGANHADCEPLTAADAAAMLQIWGGTYSWTARAVIIEVDGRRIAGSIASMPHDIEYILDNNFSGHFDLHFLNSTRHKDGLLDPYHQKQVNIAAGFSQ